MVGRQLLTHPSQEAERRVLELSSLPPPFYSVTRPPPQHGDATRWASLPISITQSRVPSQPCPEACFHGDSRFSQVGSPY